ncbi:MAG: endolytic transglycosylase MltG [Candidatus Eremiobacteraeota bacterium]|nr:endolytic transglycosylase MltG [Candidatus Eremiobacteraeota bacterium]
MWWILRALVLVFAVAIAAAAYVYYLAAFDRSRPATETNVVVARGSTTHEVARQLKASGVIGHVRLFELLARAKRVETSVKAGEYRFGPKLTPLEVLDRVVTGGSQVAVWVTIPEGFTAREIAGVLADRNLGDGAALTEYFLRETIVLPDRSRSRNLEGLLFPNTYLMPLQSTPAALARIMTDQFSTELPRDAVERAKRLKLSIPQIVTLASLIEREAKADDERRLMAGVYYNRLRLNMPLEVDATIEYTFAHHKDVITRADLARDTPYNTYLRQGLPPTPIANPGGPSLRAAFDPQPSDFLFYVYMGNGHHAFSRTLSEHNANVAKYLH